MGRGPTNENTNMYFQARKKAATYNERLWSREGAAELLGISVSTLADYELGNTKVVPVDKVVLMTMDLELAEPKKEKASSEKKKDYNVGDIVNFHGGTHYVSSYPGSKGYKARAGKAKITIKNGSGKAHPWHLIHTDSGSNVYGWVDDGTFD